MDFLDSLKIKKTPWPVTYIMALVIVLVLLSWWFSVKPDLSAHSFLPENTTFYYQWANKDWQLDQPAFIFDETQPSTKIAELENILEVMMSQAEEIIWFQTEDQTVDNYLIRFVGNFSKKEMDYLQQRHENLFFTRVNEQILLISPVEQASSWLSDLPADNFLDVQSDSGQNIYFDPEHVPDFLQPLADRLSVVFAEQKIFGHLAFDGKRYLIDLYHQQLTTEDSSVKSWANTRLPKEHSLILALSSLSNEELSWLNDFVTPYFFLDPPNFAILDSDVREEVWKESLLIKVDQDKWLWANNYDWRDDIFAVSDKFEIAEVQKVLPDGTLYTEYVKNFDQPFQELSVGDKNYWEISGLYGTEIEQLYYLSNDEDVIVGILNNSKLAGDTWGDCQFNLGSMVTDWAHLEPKTISELNLPEDFLFEIDQIDLFAYQNHSTAGIRLCLE